MKILKPVSKTKLALVCHINDQIKSNLVLALRY